jgi:hypothetical protein
MAEGGTRPGEPDPSKGGERREPASGDDGGRRNKGRWR